MATTLKKTKRKSKSNNIPKKKSPKSKRKNPKPKTKVKDIAAIFGQQKPYKKVKTRAAKAKQRRNSETLRIQIKKLKNVINSDKENENGNESPFYVKLKSPRISPFDLEDINTASNVDNIDKYAVEYITNLPKKMDDDHEIGFFDINDNNDHETHGDMDDFFINETYCHSRKCSQASFLSSVLDLDFDMDNELDMEPITFGNDNELDMEHTIFSSDNELHMEPITFGNGQEKETRDSVCGARSSVDERSSVGDDRESVIVTDREEHDEINVKATNGRQLVDMTTDVDLDIGPIGAIKSTCSNMKYKKQNDEYRRQMEENRKLSQSIILMENEFQNGYGILEDESESAYNSDSIGNVVDNDDDEVDYGSIFSMDDLGEIGAIKTSDYVSTYQSDDRMENDLLSKQTIDDREDSYVIDRFDISEIGAIKTSDYISRSIKEDNKNGMDQFASSQYYIDSDDEYYSSVSHCEDNNITDVDDIEEINNGIFGGNKHKQIGSVPELPECDSVKVDLNLYNESGKEENECEKTFHERRESQIGMDLNDLMMMSDETSSDIDEDYMNININMDNNKGGMSINELLVMFGLYLFSDSNIYNYFGSILCIRYCYEIINILPHKISKPVDCFNMKQLMKLNKMVKYISHKVYNHIWNGKYNKEWIGLEYNNIGTIFQCKSIYLMNNKECYNDDDNINSNIDSSNDNLISLNGYDTKYCYNINVNTLNNEEEITFEMNTKQLPIKYRFEPKLFKFGIEIDNKNENNQSLYITDRLIVRQNEKYVQSMFIEKFVENNSSIFMKLSLLKSNPKCLNINLFHKPNGQITTFDHTEFNKNFQITLNQNAQCAKLFITQYNGNGEYTIKKL